MLMEDWNELREDLEDGVNVHQDCRGLWNILSVEMVNIQRHQHNNHLIY